MIMDTKGDSKLGNLNFFKERLSVLKLFFSRVSKAIDNDSLDKERVFELKNFFKE